MKDVVKLEEVKKTKFRKTKWEYDKLKNYVLQKLSIGTPAQDIAKETGFTPKHISEIIRKLNGEFLDEANEKDRAKIMGKLMMRMNGVTKKLEEAYDNLDAKDRKDINSLVNLHKSIKETIEFTAKLQGLFVEKTENKVIVEESLSEEEKNKMKELFGE